MKRKRPSSLRGSVTQNNISVRMRSEDAPGLNFATRLGLLAGGLLLCVLFVVWFWQSGHMRAQGERLRDAGYDVTQKAQFAVKDIAVQGRHRASAEEILDALGTERGAPIFAFDASEAAAKLAKLSWIASATVERRLPDTISVDLVEREPAARWQHDEHLYVIDDQGHALPSANADDFPNLPLVVGTGANASANELLTLLKNYPAVQEKMDSAVRVGDRRWDLHMQPKITVRLPEEDLAGGLHRLSVLIVQERVLDRQITSIDLRVPDRLTLDPIVPAAKPPEKIHSGSNHP